MRRLALVIAALLPAVLPAQEVSVVDYLKAHKQDSAMEARAKLFKELPGKKNDAYKGTREQNLELLKSLLAKDEAATKAANGCRDQLKEVKREPTSDLRAEDYFAIPAYALVEGIGTIASFGVLLSVHISNGKIEDRQIEVVVKSAAAQLAQLEATGTVFVSVNGKETAFPLQPPWFATIGPQGDRDIYLYGKKGQSLAIPADAKVTARFEVFPVIKTNAGLSPIIPWGTGRLVVQASPTPEKREAKEEAVGPSRLRLHSAHLAQDPTPATHMATPEDLENAINQLPEAARSAVYASNGLADWIDASGKLRKNTATDKDQKPLRSEQEFNKQKQLNCVTFASPVLHHLLKGSFKDFDPKPVRNEGSETANFYKLEPHLVCPTKDLIDALTEKDPAWFKKHKGVYYFDLRAGTEGHVGFLVVQDNAVDSVHFAQPAKNPPTKGGLTRQDTETFITYLQGSRYKPTNNGSITLYSIPVPKKETKK